MSCDKMAELLRNSVTVQPFGFTVTESVHLKLPTARGGFTLGKIYIFLRALQQVQSPTLNCYEIRTVSFPHVALLH